MIGEHFVSGADNANAESNPNWTNTGRSKILILADIFEIFD